MAVLSFQIFASAIFRAVLGGGAPGTCKDQALQYVRNRGARAISHLGHLSPKRYPQVISITDGQIFLETELFYKA